MAGLSVSPSPTLTAGGQATVTYTGGTPNGQVTVDIDNGELPPNNRTDTITIQLDGRGDGSGTWNVPATGWEAAKFNAPNATEVTRLITHSSPPH